MELKDTITLMKSDDYKDRFRAEYYQTRIRYYKLGKILNDYENNNLDFNLTTPIKILYKQYYDMKNYLLDLEIRAELEKIKL